jgi:hypothetical protein
MKRGAIIGISIAIVLVILTALLSSKYFHSALLTPSELALKGSIMRPPMAWADDCSKIRRAMALSIKSAGSGHKRPIRNTTPLSTDEVAIYKAVLQRWVANDRTSLNVSARTFPLEEASSSSGISECECLQGMQVGSLLSAFHSFHNLTPDVLPGKNMRLVDANKQAIIVSSNDPGKTIDRGNSVESAVKGAFATGLFSVSEIAFDSEHQHALVSYRFWCGSLCGSGATLVFEKVGGEWKSTDRMCGGWVS